MSKKFSDPQCLKYYVFYGLYSLKWEVGVSNDTLYYGAKYYTKENATIVKDELNAEEALPKMSFTKILKD